MTPCQIGGTGRDLSGSHALAIRVLSDIDSIQCDLSYTRKAGGLMIHPIAHRSVLMGYQIHQRAAVPNYRRVTSVAALGIAAIESASRQEPFSLVLIFDVRVHMCVISDV